MIGMSVQWNVTLLCQVKQRPSPFLLQTTGEFCSPWAITQATKLKKTQKMWWERKGFGVVNQGQNFSWGWKHCLTKISMDGSLHFCISPIFLHVSISSQKRRSAWGSMTWGWGRGAPPCRGHAPWRAVRRPAGGHTRRGRRGWASGAGRSPATSGWVAPARMWHKPWRVLHAQKKYGHPPPCGAHPHPDPTHPCLKKTVLHANRILSTLLSNPPRTPTNQWQREELQGGDGQDGDSPAIEHEEKKANYKKFIWLEYNSRTNPEDQRIQNRKHLNVHRPNPVQDQFRQKKILHFLVIFGIWRGEVFLLGSPRGWI